MSSDAGIVHQEIDGTGPDFNPRINIVECDPVGGIQRHRMYAGFLGRFNELAGGTSGRDNLMAVVGLLHGYDSSGAVTPTCHGT